MKKTICVIGLGYIGLPTSVIFADNGYDVIGVDINKEIVEEINKGETRLEEKGFSELLKKVVDERTFIAKTDVQPADAYIICVPTPILKGQNRADMKYVRSATEAIVPNLKKGDLVILESTSPPKTCTDLIVPILEKSGLKKGEFYVSHCPERLFPGNLMHELIYNDRTIGGIDEESSKLSSELYSSFAKGNIYITDSTTAELSKLTENTFRDVNIALANSLAKICDELGIDVLDLISLANKHPRVNVHTPGCGVGGHCIPLDPWFIDEVGENGVELIWLSRKLNDSMPKYTSNLLINSLKKLGIRPQDATVAVLGLSYKADIADDRESPSLNVVNQLKIRGVNLKVFDPYILEHSSVETLEEALSDVDAVVLTTAHEVFRNITPEQFKSYGIKVLIDGRNVYNPKKMREQGIIFKGIGR